MANENVTSVKKQAEQKAMRRDPAPRHTDFAAHLPIVKNQDPDRKYVLVNASSVQMGIDFYEELGYVIERDREGGPRIMSGRGQKPGEPIQHLGSTLMSIEAAKAEDYRVNGGPGAGLGLAFAEKRDRSVRPRKGVAPTIEGFRADKYMTARDVGEVEEGLARSI